MGTDQKFTSRSSTMVKLNNENYFIFLQITTKTEKMCLNIYDKRFCITPISFAIIYYYLKPNLLLLEAKHTFVWNTICNLAHHDASLKLQIANARLWNC